MRARAWLLLAVAVASAGCFSEILPAPPVTTLAFACGAVDPLTEARVRVASYVDDPGATDAAVAQAAATLAAELVRVSGRDASAVTTATREAPPEPAKGWNETRLAAWARADPFIVRDQVTLRVLWLESLDDGQAGLVPAPGAVVLSRQAVASGAARLGHPEGDVAAAVLLHFAGHALGVTNRGIPVQDPALQEREGPAGHDADPRSVLAVGWEDARTMAWDANATYDRFPDAALADWQAARGPAGVCGVRR